MDTKYPIGMFACPEKIEDDDIFAWIAEIRALPQQLKEAVRDIDDALLEKTYRENGWTIREIVHHLADSHMNAYIRIRLALTEQTPVIKPYDQDQWAKLPDSRLPIAVSLQLLEGLHERWTYLLEHLTAEQRKLLFYHPESGLIAVEKSIGMYAWHGKHHLAHIRQALQP